MKNALNEILKTFSENDKVRFQEFLSSPYHNKIKNAVKLFSVVKDKAEALDSGELTKEEIWSKLFKSKEFNYGTLKNLFHELQKLAEKFLMYEKFQEYSYAQFKHMYEGLIYRHLYSVLDTKDKILEKNISDEKITNSKEAARFIFQDLMYIYQLKMWKEHIRDPRANLPDDRFKQDIFFICHTLINLFLNFIVSKGYSQNDLKEEGRFGLNKFFLDQLSENFISTILSEIKTESYAGYAVVNSYYLGYKAITNEDNDKEYFRFKNFLFENFKYLSASNKSELTGALDHALYYSTAIKNKNEEKLDILELKFANNVFEVYTGGVLLYNLKPFFDNNRADKFREILDKYAKYLYDEDKEECIGIANAQYYFMKKEFDRSLNELSKISSNVFELKLIMKRLFLMIYFEINEYELFLNAYDSYKHFIKNFKFNSKLRSTQNKEANSFFNLINELFRLRLNFDEFIFSSLETKIKGMSVNHKQWFLRKLNEMKPVC